VLAIRAERLEVDPDSCKFVVGRTVHPGGPFFFGDRESARGSPLVEQLFEIPGVRSVLVADTVVTVGKSPEACWEDLAKPIGAAIRGMLQSGVPAIFQGPKRERTSPRTDAAIAADVEELLAKEVNPAIAAHGGKIALAGVVEGVVRLRMSGGCQGCAAAAVTLHRGVEVMIRRAIPEVKAVLDVTAHAAGANPYYKP
jgi:Fe-S cluster biogenesis protein NfuA